MNLQCLDMDTEEVADQIEKIHSEYASVIQYNDENSLSSVLAIAYLSAMQYYFKPIQELPTGRGEEALQTSYFFLSQSIGTIILHLSLN